MDQLIELGGMPHELDAGVGGRARVGLIVLATDQTIEHEWRQIFRGLDGVAVYQSRIWNDARITPETRGMFNADTFALMRPGTYFVNSARGELVDTDALVEALRSGHLSGAALDVFLPEPPPADHPLLSMPNVMAVSHLAGSSRQVAERAARMMAAEAGRFVRGEPLVNPF